MYQPWLTNHANHTLPLWPHVRPGPCQLYNGTGIEQTVSIRVANCREKNEKDIRARLFLKIAAQLRTVAFVRGTSMVFEEGAVPLRPTPLVLQSFVRRWFGCEVRTTRCCMSLQVRFLLEAKIMPTE